MLQIPPTFSHVVRIQKARTALLLDHPFFGTLLFRLGARACSPIATMATNGVSLYFNPEFVETLCSAELIGTLAHEVMHPALQHHTRRAGRSPKRWNMACDDAINPMLRDAGLMLPKDVLYEARFVGMSAEEIYNLLEAEENNSSQDPDGLTALWGTFPETAPAYPVIWASTETRPVRFGQVIPLGAA